MERNPGLGQSTEARVAFILLKCNIFSKMLHYY